MLLASHHRFGATEFLPRFATDRVDAEAGTVGGGRGQYPPLVARAEGYRPKASLHLPWLGGGRFARPRECDRCGDQLPQRGSTSEENVILGTLIPAVRGIGRYRNIHVQSRPKSPGCRVTILLQDQYFFFSTARTRPGHRARGATGRLRYIDTASPLRTSRRAWRGGAFRATVDGWPRAPAIQRSCATTEPTRRHAHALSIRRAGPVPLPA